MKIPCSTAPLASWALTRLSAMWASHEPQNR